MAKNKGRPTVDTPDVRRKIEQAAALDASVEEIAFFAGIHRDTLHQILKKDSGFSDRIEALRNKPILMARQTVIKSLTNPDHAFKYLEKKRKKEFGATVDHTTGGEKITGINYIVPNGTDTRTDV